MRVPHRLPRHLPILYREMHLPLINHLQLLGDFLGGDEEVGGLLRGEVLEFGDDAPRAHQHVAGGVRFEVDGGEDGGAEEEDLARVQGDVAECDGLEEGFHDYLL